MTDARCNLCDLPRLQCVHGMTKAKPRRKTAKKQAPAPLIVTCGICKKRKAVVPEIRRGKHVKKARCQRCINLSKRRKGSVWTVASAGSPGLGKRA